MTEIVLVAAVAENGVIGRDNRLPWRLKSDLKHFRALTLGKPVLMGRKTFLSIGKPLPGRTNIVVSRNPDFSAPGVAVARDLAAALGVAHGDALRRGVEEIMVMGGAQIFAELLPSAARLEITRVHASPEGDTVFPPIDPAVWRETASVDHEVGPSDDAAFTVLTYRRMEPAL
jgi:dihydrofolate reductase